MNKYKCKECGCIFTITKKGCYKFKKNPTCPECAFETKRYTVK